MLAAVKESTLVLLSGGIDSCATLELYRRRDASVSALFVDYGQAAAAQEYVAVQRIAVHYQVTLSLVRCTGLGEFKAGYVRGRNALLLQVALTAAPFEVGQIATGLHAGTPYADCMPVFVAEMQRCFDLYCGGKIQIVAPFLDEDKRGVVAFCREAAVPLDMTYSCESGGAVPCGECSSCLDRKVLGV
jgi:7-cyano-7-deazaguanine synthase